MRDVTPGAERPWELQDLPKLADSLGPNGRLIFNRIVPRVLARFANAQQHYGDACAFELGKMAQFIDINRKIGPLRRALWEGFELTREPVDEILEDLIGHCLLTLLMLDMEKDHGPDGDG